MGFCTSEEAAVQHPLLLGAASPSEHTPTAPGTFQHRVKQRGSHLSPVCFLLRPQRDKRVRGRDAAMAVTAGLCNGAGFSPPQHGAVLGSTGGKTAAP